MYLIKLNELIIMLFIVIESYKFLRLGTWGFHKVMWQLNNVWEIYI